MQFLRVSFLIAMALSVSGCWEAEKPLIPDNAKVALFAKPTTLYVDDKGKEVALSVTPQPEGEFLFQNLNNPKEKPDLVAFSYVAGPRNRTDFIGVPYSETIYLAQSRRPNEMDGASFSIVIEKRTNNNQVQADLEYLLFVPECAEAIGRIADGKSKGLVCNFATYDALYAAAKDTAQWMGDSRLRLYSQSFRTKSLPKDIP
jgi:hypothetical protein